MLKRTAKRKKEKELKAVGVANPRACMDRISELPDFLIHHILSFLPPKDAARTRVLSRKWRLTFASFPILDFDQRHFERQREQPCVSSGKGNMDMIGKNFKKSIDNSLQSWPKNINIQKFRLFVTAWTLELDRSIYGWIEDVALCNVKELDLQFKNCRWNFTSSNVFSVKTIIGLRLSGCYVENCNINLPLMQKLYLGSLKIDQIIFENLISSCPLIEDLRLVFCRGLKNVQLSNLLKLNRVELKHCCDLTIVDITAPNFQTFWFYGKKSKPCDINLAGCRTLKKLTLCDYNLTGEWLQNQGSSFPALEVLSLSRCNQSKNVIISSEKLKTLSLRRCGKLKVTISDVPSLTSFEFEGDEMASFAMDPSCLQEVKLSFRQLTSEISALRCAQLEHFLSRLNHGSGLKLVVSSNKDVVIHEDLNEMSFPPFGSLRLEIVRSSTTFEDVVDHVLQTYHPDSLSVMKSSLEKILKFLSTVRSGVHNPSCCGFNTNKCWRHGLVDYHQIVPEEEYSEVNKKEGTEWFEWIKRHLPGGHFVLKWKK